MRIFSERNSLFLLVLLFGHQFTGCSTPGPGLFAKKTPHEQYGQKLTDAGLSGSAVGQLWFQAADKSLHAPLPVTLPYRESGYFAADRPSAAGIRFAVKRGEKISIALDKNPPGGFALFCDVWALPPDASSKPKLLAAFDTSGKPLELDVREDGIYALRVQPELLQSGNYTLSISTGPSLAYPIPVSIKAPVGSFWGAGRDNGARKHEGVDIFAPKHSPAVACADGVITSVSENNLGGRVVFLRPTGRNLALYYAHLDSQLVETGQSVRKGDTLGLTGNTGNARFTASHLHFGIYTSGGAIDPLPFINPLIKEPLKVHVPLANLGKPLRSGSRSKLYPEPVSRPEQAITLEASTLVYADAGTGNWYRVRLPDGQQGFISSAELRDVQPPLRRLTMRTEAPLLDRPDATAPRIALLPSGRQLDVLAAYKNFYFVASRDTALQGWVARQLLP